MRAFIIVSLGAGLFAFQNCGSQMEANQTIENMEFNENHKDANNLSESPLMAQAALKRPGTCLTSDLKFAWPLGGTMYHDWDVVNYVDDDTRAPNLLDYFGAVDSTAITYNAHMGVDIDVPSFRYMDNDFPVLAAAPGTVVQTTDGSFDRNLACSTDVWNHVVVRHANGFLSIYGHMKKGSVAVQIGDVVVAGQKLGVVGSSGCSTYPHLHFEVWDCSNNVVDAMKLGMFAAPPVYSRQAPTTVMQSVVKQPVMTSIAQMADPGPDSANLKVNSQFSIGLTIANLKPGDLFGVSVYDPSGAQRPLGFKSTSSNYYRQSHWWVNTAFDTPGVWTVYYGINGASQSSQKITIVP